MRLNDYYHDRGMQKFMGFYLSEHTTKLKHETKKNSLVHLPKPQMSEVDFYELLEYAILKHLRVAVQLNEKLFDSESFLEDITGHIKGYSEDLLFLDDTSLPIKIIRNVAIITSNKWFE